MTVPQGLPTSFLPVAFRDTALTVVTLGTSDAPSSFKTLRPQCLKQIQRLREEMNANGQTDDVIQDAMYAQCALLDEAALRHLTGPDRDAWEREPLQVSQFGTHDAGEALVTRIQYRLQQAQPANPVLAVFFAVLSLGFQGRFALEEPDVRDAMIHALNDRLGGAEDGAGGVVVRSATRRRWWANVSLPAWVVLTMAMAAMVWLLLDRWLSLAAAKLLP